MTDSLAMINGVEIVILVGVVVLLFGSAKIPQLMRGLGSGISEFKKGLKEGETPPAEPGKPAAPPPGPAASTEQKPPEPPPQAK